MDHELVWLMFCSTLCSKKTTFSCLVKIDQKNCRSKNCRTSHLLWRDDQSQLSFPFSRGCAWLKILYCLNKKKIQWKLLNVISLTRTQSDHIKRLPLQISSILSYLLLTHVIMVRLVKLLLKNCYWKIRENTYLKSMKFRKIMA